MRRLAVLAALAWLAGCGEAPAPEVVAPTPPTDEAAARADAIRAATATVSDERIRAADAEPGNWLAHGRTYDEQRHSPLAEIDQSNVSGLGLAWHWNTGDLRGLEATPIVVDGVMFTTGAWSRVYANDARTGEPIWRYDPQVDRARGRYACCDVVNRGVAAWRGRVFVGTLDGRLVALDAGTGEVIWETLTIDPEQPYTIIGAPRVVKDLVVIGNDGADYGARGYVTAYDWQTGERRWRFWTVPGDPSQPSESRAMELAAPTWRGGRWWENGGGGTASDSMAYDPELNLLYVGVGSGSPWNRDARSPGGGDNWFLASIVAINADNGTLAWHYQTTPGDTWGYGATGHMILADLTIDGAPRKVVMQAPKNGFFYVLDRTDGRFISAAPYVRTTWASHIDPATGRPVENPGARYANHTETVFPSPAGGHGWQPMAFSPDTGYAYIPALDAGAPYARDGAFAYRPGHLNTGLDLAALLPAENLKERVAARKEIEGRLVAWDPVHQREAWSARHAGAWNGGALSTAGDLVFQGRADGRFAAYAADTGRLLWETPVHSGVVAAPVAYAVDGEQYVAVMAGWGGAFALSAGVPRHRGNVRSQGRILAFKLGADAEPPRPSVTHVSIPEPPEIRTTPEQVAQGKRLYHAWCASCHGAGVQSGGAVADLKFLPEAGHRRWDLIVREGVYASVGMPAFGDVLDEADSASVRAYVIAEANAAIALCRTDYPRIYPDLFGTACTKRVVAAD